MPQENSQDCTDAAKRFKLGSCIGSGAFASIYSGVDLTTKKRIAIKKIVKSSKGKLSNDEFMLSKDLKHPNVVRTLDCVCSSKEIYLALELCNGGDLFSKLDPKGSGLQEKAARRYMNEVTKGLTYIHSCDIVHSDIKPENVLLHNGTVKICDFGLAAKAGSTRTGSSKGTGAYMAPELVNRANPKEEYMLETSQDVWSFGVVLYAVLFADLPWEKARPSDSDFALFCRLGGVSPKVHPFQHISKPMRKFMKMLFHFNPDKRPTMKQCVDFTASKVQWYERSNYGRSSISFGMKVNKAYKKDAYEAESDNDSETSSVSDGSVPSIHDVDVSL